MSAFHVGTSGWSYKHWREIFYPRELKTGQWFEFYAQQFDCVELNTSFYHLPQAAQNISLCARSASRILALRRSPRAVGKISRCVCHCRVGRKISVRRNRHHRFCVLAFSRTKRANALCGKVFTCAIAALCAARQTMVSGRTRRVGIFQ